MDSYYQNYSLNPDYEDEEPVPAECICENYIGTSKAEYCPACKAWTDDIELAVEAAVDNSPETAAYNQQVLEDFNRRMMKGPAIEQMLTNMNRVMSAVYQAMDKKEVA